MRLFVAIVAHPVNALTHHIATHPQHKQHVKHGVAIVLLCSGSVMATSYPGVVPHFLWDGVAYLIHGLGAAPLIESALCAAARRRQQQEKDSKLENPS